MVIWDNSDRHMIQECYVTANIFRTKRDVFWTDSCMTLSSTCNNDVEANTTTPYVLWGLIDQLSCEVMTNSLSCVHTMTRIWPIVVLRTPYAIDKILSDLITNALPRMHTGFHLIWFHGLITHTYKHSQWRLVTRMAVTWLLTHIHFRYTGKLCSDPLQWKDFIVCITLC